MNKKELIEYCESLKGDLNKFINGVDVNKIIKKIEQLDEPQKPVVPQFVADWYEENKDDFEGNLFRCIDCIPGLYSGEELNDFEEWVIDSRTKPFQTLVNMHQFGYTVEKEKRYIVKVKNALERQGALNRSKKSGNFIFSSPEENLLYDTKFTRKELEGAGFGWVFDCEGIEIEEVE